MVYQLRWSLKAKAILVEEQQWYYLTYAWEVKEVHIFSKGISPKVNVKAGLEFEITLRYPLRHEFFQYNYTISSIPIYYCCIAT